MQIINRCEHAPEVLDGLRGDFELHERARQGQGRRARSTTSSPPSSTRRCARSAPPCTRPSCARRSWPRAPSRASTCSSTRPPRATPRCPSVLRATGRECRIYGMRRDLKADVVEGNLRYRPFSEAGFIDDLRTARGRDRERRLHADGRGGLPAPADAGGAGRRQFEQVLNARYLEREGYGLAAEELDRRAPGRFLERLPDFERSSRATARTATATCSPRSTAPWKPPAPATRSPQTTATADRRHPQPTTGDWQLAIADQVRRPVIASASRQVRVAEKTGRRVRSDQRQVLVRRGGGAGRGAVGG